MENKKLIEEYKKGNTKAFEELVKNNMYLAKMILDKFDYKSEDHDDLLQDGYECLIKSIKKYISGTYNCSLNMYLNNSLKHYYYFHIRKINKENKLEALKYADDYSKDFICELEEKEILNQMEDFIFKSDYLEFMRQTVLMAKMGYINNIKFSDKQLASAFSCSNKNVNYKYKETEKQIKIDNINKIMKKNIEKEDFTDFFSYIRTSERVVRYFMENLETCEIDLLKKVWGDNLDNINGIKNANISEKEALEYYKVVYKLYDAMTSADMMEVANKIGGNFHIIRKH